VVENHQGKALGVALASPGSLICARMASRDPKQQLDQSLLVHRFNIARSLRERLFPGSFYRLVYGESDGLPGLVVDRFNDIFCVQISTSGMEVLKNDITAALEKCFAPLNIRAIVFRNDLPMRELENLPADIEIQGDLPDLVSVEENNTSFVTSIAEGQKTGWFYDHRCNRQTLNQLVKGKRVLDLFSYVGSWGIQALNHGASEAVFVDSSVSALDILEENSHLNNVSDKVQMLQGDAREAIKQLISEKQKFDVVILDPPAFIKRQKDKKNGEKAYHHYNQQALRLLENDGLLVSASCSMHLSADNLADVIRVAGRKIDRTLQIIHRGSQAADHPVHPSIPETEYLKAFFVRSLFLR
jgi:23S rRNA (cytosine1962-C5)-methyltransferase